MGAYKDHSVNSSKNNVVLTGKVWASKNSPMGRNPE